MRTLRHDETGLTLAEMLLVLAIMALVAGLVVGRGLPGTAQLRQSELESYVRQARDFAVAKDRRVSLVSSPDERGFEATSGAASFDLGSGFSVQAEGPSGHKVDFDPDGSSPGGTLSVIMPDGATFGLSVEPITGIVRALR